MLRTITFHGVLAEKYKPIQLDADNSPMLFAGLRSVYPDFRKDIANLSEIAVVAAKRTDGKPEAVQVTDYLFPFADATEIHIVPVAEGDYLQIAGAIIEYFGAAGITAAIIYVAVAVAMIYALSAIAQAMAPKPSTSKGAAQDASFIFNGPQNATRQGGAVPILYGTALVGSTIIASDYVSLDMNSFSGANSAYRGGGGYFNR
jgi:predicted phage tail protein